MSANGFKIWTDKFLFENEGEYGDDARDPGGPTMRGITWVAYAANAAKVYPKASYDHWRNLSLADAKKFARWWWIDWQGDAIKDDRLAVMIVYAHWASLAKGFDLVQKMQQWINSNTAKKIKVDGLIKGSETVKALNSLSPSQTTFLAEYALKVSTQQFKEDPNYEYFRGWDKIINFLEEVVATGKKP